MFVFVSLIFLFIISIYFWIKKIYSYWSEKGFLQNSNVKFPFGSLTGVGKKFTTCEALDIIYREIKGKSPVVGIYFFFKPTLMVIDPELIKKIFVQDFTYFQDRGFYHNKNSDPISANLLTLEGQEWKERRSKLSPIFSSGKMKMMFHIVDLISSRLIEAIEKDLQNSSDLEMRNWAQRFTADNISSTAFGLDAKCLEDENSEFLKHGRRLFDLTPFETLKFFFTIGCPNFCRKLGVRTNPKEPTDFFLKTFLETFEYREKNNIQRNDFVSLLLGLKELLTPIELAAEAFLMFAAGYETSSTLMTFILYELALNPDIQQKLRDEIVTRIEENDGKLTYEMLNEFKYLDMVTNETLRKYPPIPNNIRMCTKDYKIEELNLTIPKGTAIELPVYSLQHDPEYFPNPNTFDPERFNDENVKNIKQFTFFPFGEGKRQCLGLRFGLMQTKMGIAKLLINYSFSSCEKTIIPMKFVPSAPFLQPKGGLWLKVEKIL
ncbi:hypothetical protein PVAND_002250 [Polypedilum vanderplanki]|uniref:Cytochrome P450 n=1 Tax=Polypedilum vanderplanki TaxID=319348 RepID=A0A9J6BQP3_POLVA|nr:hypothetical protein PVAND_002250 [Polypedilum vanderplanki]